MTSLLRFALLPAAAALTIGFAGRQDVKGEAYEPLLGAIRNAGKEKGLELNFVGVEDEVRVNIFETF